MELRLDDPCHAFYQAASGKVGPDSPFVSLPTSQPGNLDCYKDPFLLFSLQRIETSKNIMNFNLSNNNYWYAEGNFFALVKCLFDLSVMVGLLKAFHIT